MKIVVCCQTQNTKDDQVYDVRNKTKNYGYSYVEKLDLSVNLGKML